MTDFDDLDELLSQSIELDISKVKHGTQDFLTADLFSTMTDDEVLSHFIPIRGIDYDSNYISDDSLNLKKDKGEGNVIYMADEFLPYRMIPQMNPIYQLNSELLKSVIPTNRAKETVGFPMAGVLKCKEEFSEVSLIGNSVNNPGKQCVTIQRPLDKPGKQCITNPTMNEKSEDFSTVSVRNLCPAVTTATEEKAGIEETNELSPTVLISNGTQDTKETSNRKKEPRPIIKRKPRTYKYNPKPLQQKVNRAFVPDDLKDIEYWERRKRNNEAAKKSRKERREKELEIVQNYEEMRHEFQTIKNENIRLKARNALLEKQVKELRSKKQ